MQGAVSNLGAWIGDALVSAISADERLARSTRIRCADDTHATAVEHARTKHEL
jgi:hypothetical protein